MTSVATSHGASPRSFRKEALILGLVSLAGPLAMNMYVPAFPEMARALETTSAAIQLSLTSYLAALAVGQNIFGPVSDRFGRKPALYAGLLLFVVASIGASLAVAVEQLIVWRFLQGIGACAAMAVPRALIRDRYTGSTAARMMSLMVLVISIGPLMSPMAGTALVGIYGWTSIFWFLTAAGVLALTLVVTQIPETLPVARRVSGMATLRSYGLLLLDRSFICAALMIGFAQATFFAYVSGSPFVFMTIHELTPLEFSIVFGFAAVVWAGSAQLSGPLMDRFGALRLLGCCVSANAVFTSALLVAGLLDLGGMLMLILGVAMVFASLGILVPVGTVTALHAHGAAAGSASAILGTAGFAAGALASIVVAATADGTDLPMLGTMTACALLSAAAASVALKARPTDDG
ncbi:multidrug effflux MFS transporter [Falsirhodobacter halotolerans]|uniref:multidrug effflux MFS transporter n=1 Tax=Falsirhodobacter halotolerans TaxID=1146892 RepID=UPI002453B2B9|nr:multidrug effflux MFS transporter [Falsirhodobacter halotolerans]